MARTVGDLEADLRANPSGVRFADATRLAEHYFGPARSKGGSHNVYKMPWPMDPRVNLQNTKNGEAKPYQVRQLLAAIDKLKTLNPGIIP